MKVQILDCCEHCDGEAYIFECKDVDSFVEPSTTSRLPHWANSAASGGILSPNPLQNRTFVLSLTPGLASVPLPLQPS